MVIRIHAHTATCLPGKISGHVVTKYVNITDTIAVPAKWPAHVFRESLVQLVEQMIIALNSGKSVVLQVLNTPAKLVQCQDRNGIQYFFEKVFRECVNALEHRVSLNDYNVQVYRSELRTAFYVMPIAQEQQHGSCQRKTLSERFMAPIKKLYYVIHFITSPYWITEKFVVVPSTWVSFLQKQAMVAFPLLGKKKFFSYIKKRRSSGESWPTFPVTIEYKTNVYKDAVLYIELRQKLWSSFVTSSKASASSKLMTEDIQVVDVLSSELEGTNDLPNATSSSTAKTSDNKIFEAPYSSEPGRSLAIQEIYDKATKHDLFIKILDKINEVNELLDDYMKMEF
uniref:Uncharacterized protein n=1 Tax=Glyptapanteles indiensis TaxID=92994 RepID=B7S942_GLYIN|nr:hypothetical protein GIP_L8_0310 [Glyptapanteles indiensis]